MLYELSFMARYLAAGCAGPRSVGDVLYAESMRKEAKIVEKLKRRDGSTRESFELNGGKSVRERKLVRGQTSKGRPGSEFAGKQQTEAKLQ